MKKPAKSTYNFRGLNQLNKQKWSLLKFHYKGTPWFVKELVKGG